MKPSLSIYKGNTKTNILLVAVWGMVIVTGFLALGAILGNIEGLIVFGRIHSLAVRLSLAYTVIHLFQHKKKRSLRPIQLTSSTQTVSLAA